jgi:hypothetical protein
MRKPQLLLIGLIIFSASILLSQTVPSTLPSKGPKIFSATSADYAGEMWLFHVGAKHYRARITKEEIIAGPDWRPSTPLPLSLSKAEEIARVELRKLGVNDVGWDVTDLHLKRLRANDQSKWYYVVGLGPAVPKDAAAHDSFFAIISLSGNPGVIESDPTAR